jgi:regulator of sirC expression with transglutaminase-like and TPR domain
MLSSNLCLIDDTLKALKKLLSDVNNALVDDWDPIELGLLFSKLEYEDLDMESFRKQFKSLVEEIRSEIPTEKSFREQTQHLSEAFSKKLGFSGDSTNYYNLKNSFLSDVITRRKGIPISMSLLFMGFCRELGLKAVGISFPGHFLVKVMPSTGHFDRSHNREVVNDWAEQWFVDAFDQGKILTQKDCEKRLQDWTRGLIPFSQDVFRVAHPVDIVSRMARNLRAILMEKEDLARLYWVLSTLIEVCPQEKIESFKDRGVLLARVGRYAQARGDFNEYLRLSDDPRKKAQVEGLLRFLENQVELPN